MVLTNLLFVMRTLIKVGRNLHILFQIQYIDRIELLDFIGKDLPICMYIIIFYETNTHKYIASLLYLTNLQKKISLMNMTYGYYLAILEGF